MLRLICALAGVLAFVGPTEPAFGADLPDQAGAGAILDHFRRSIYAEPVYIEFELREMPRRGAERLYQGRLWGARNEKGPVARFELAASPGAPAHHILVQGGPDPSLWVATPPGPVFRSETALLAPLIPGLQMTPFDLQMPYLYWLDAALTGEQRVRGRSSYVYTFTPPGEFAAANPGIRAVRVYLDTQYDALMQSEILGADGKVAKTLSLLELRKVGDRWLPRDLDVRDDLSRDKTRLSVTAIAIGISVDPAAFEPDQLAASASAPPSSSVTRVTQ